MSEELEELRRKRLLALRQKLNEEQGQEQMKRQIELQKQALLRNILTPEARQRLANLKMVKPDFIEQLELQLIQLAQQGRLKIPLTDTQFKRLLIQLQPRKREMQIRRR